MGNRLVLGIDNSIDFLNVGLSLEEHLLEERSIRSTRHPSQIIATEVLDILARHGYGPADLNLIVATIGPGSFTGIRVGLAFCKGLSAGRGIPLLGVPSLDVLASSLAFMKGYYLCPMIDAKKGEIFTAIYRAVHGGSLDSLKGYLAVKPEAATAIIREPCLCFGTGVSMAAPFLSKMRGVTLLPDRFARISAAALIKEGLTRTTGTPAESVKPIYGRRSEAEIKFNVELV
jgi:tRNA threonylcarbamoyladenosine biosynthesis protein TsaB